MSHRNSFTIIKILLTALIPFPLSFKIAKENEVSKSQTVYLIN